MENLVLFPVGNYPILVNKHGKEAETNFLSQSSDESDSEYDRDWPIQEDNPSNAEKKESIF